MFELGLRVSAATARILRAAWDGERCARWRCRAAVRLAGAHLDHVTAGQTALAWCGCGERIAEYHQGWFHVLNPELRGTDDHCVEPAFGMIRYRHWRPADAGDY